MIHIKNPVIIKEGHKSRCNCEVIIDNYESRTIWFEVDEKYENYLCDERSDAYVIGLLLWCIREGHDIYCDAPVTEELLFNIKKILLPALIKYSNGVFNSIEIFAKTAPPLEGGNAVGTGCSCGIDSFTSIYNHMNTEFPQHDITHLCINNVGAFNESYSDYGVEQVKQERYNKTRQLIDEYNGRFELVETDSNFLDVFYQTHYYTHTFSSIFAVYMLQKLWKYYYYASAGEGYENFSVKDISNIGAAKYEIISLPCFSISNLKIISESAELNRLEKTKQIIDIPIVQKYLHVCIEKPYNCGVCSKCRRTLVTIDLLGKLDKYETVFDIDYYKKHRDEYYIWLYEKHLEDTPMIKPIYDEFSNDANYQQTINKYLRNKKRERNKRKLIHMIPKNIKTLIKGLIKLINK